MIILGIDPGSRIIGFGIIKKSNKNYDYITSGCITTNAKEQLYKRIEVITNEINKLINYYKPNHVIVEKIFLNINPISTLILGQARGAILASISLHKLPVFEYTALQIKKAVVGYGKASKNQVQHMVVNLLKLSGTPQSDAADALAVAITHATRYDFNQKTI